MKQRRRLASRMHPDKGGDAVQYQEMQKAAEVLLQAAAAWKAMADTFPTVCICCHCPTDPVSSDSSAPAQPRTCPR